MKIAIGSDHAGFKYKQILIKYLKSTNIEVTDFGTHSDEMCDYPDIIRPIAENVASGAYDTGIILGGSGNGEAIVANKVKGVRCALCWDEYTAQKAKEHNNANMISIGERTVSIEMAKKIVETFLYSNFSGGRHQIRVNKIVISE
ncbi:ribose 5-phosphate isomerase B [Lentisphaerota bacterium WC36G]|nr:ribose 5-phosphate isomerase B [Lentisphaerae bacterium WC36]